LIVLSKAARIGNNCDLRPALQMPKTAWAAGSEKSLSLQWEHCNNARIGRVGDTALISLHFSGSEYFFYPLRGHDPDGARDKAMRGRKALPSRPFAAWPGGSATVL
jgi:hypothetical protein